MRIKLTILAIFIIAAGCTPRYYVDRDTLSELGTTMKEQREEIRKLRQHLESLKSYNVEKLKNITSLEEKIESLKENMSSMQATAARVKTKPRGTTNIKVENVPVDKIKSFLVKDNRSGRTEEVNIEEKIKYEEAKADKEKKIENIIEDETEKENENINLDHIFPDFYTNPDVDDNVQKKSEVEENQSIQNYSPVPPYKLKIWLVVHDGKVYKHRMDPIAYPGDIRKVGHTKTSSGYMVTFASTFDPSIRWRTLLPKSDGKYHIEARLER